MLRPPPCALTAERCSRPPAATLPSPPSPRCRRASPRSQQRAKVSLLQRAYPGAPAAEVYMESTYFNYSECVSAEFGQGRLSMPPDPSMGIPVRTRRGGAQGAPAPRGPDARCGARGAGRR